MPETAGGTIWLAVLAAYAIGALPFSYWLVRWRRGADVRLVGSGNPGATNALRVGGAPVGFVALALDVFKGWVAIEVGRRLGVSDWALGAVALAAVAGHVFPIWLGLRGGKGVATAAGTFLALAPVALGLGVIAFVVVVLWTRLVSLGSITAAVTVPIASALLALRSGLWSERQPVIVWIAVISLLILVRHRKNLQRLLAGREARLGIKVEDS